MVAIGILLLLLSFCGDKVYKIPFFFISHSHLVSTCQFLKAYHDDHDNIKDP